MQTIGQAQSSSMEQQTDQPKHSKAQCLNLLRLKKPNKFFNILVYALYFKPPSHIYNLKNSILPSSTAKKMFMLK